ncbi:MAG: exonuclease SbcCD subunit D [Deltaproteobacteria bacterium]|nr:exonuclease SbcCD subunit D [Deltaproteobacteria bacterium]
MRILHTSDWHLGARLGSQDRWPDHLARLRELCAYIDQEAVDILLVAGDVFDEHRAEPLAVIISELARLLASRIEAGLSCVFIAGNHDREHVFPFLRGLQDLVSPTSQRRVIFTERPRLARIESRSNETINLMLLPYPTPVRYDLGDEHWPSPDKKRADLADAVRFRIKELSEETRQTSRGLQTVLCGHFLMRGVKEGHYQLSEQDDVPVEAGDLPSYAYVALGHIHKPQLVGAPHIRYCGSLERMDRAEMGYDKQALLIDINRGGLQEIRELPLHATPFAHVQATSAAELEAAATDLADREHTMVSVTFTLEQGESFGALQARARQLFPRLYGSPEVRWAHAPSSPTHRGDPSVLNRRDVAGTVRAYLQRTLKDDPDAEALRQEADALLAEIESTPL